MKIPLDSDEPAGPESTLAPFFGPKVSIADLVRVHEAGDLRVVEMDVTARGPDGFETSARLGSEDGTITGEFVNRWRRGRDGLLMRLGESALRVSDSGRRLGLQLHVNLVEFARKAGTVGEFEVEGRDVGRYAYRFLHGVDVDAGTREDVGRRLGAWAGRLGVEIDAEAFAALKSPGEIVDFVLLPRIYESWMAEVNRIVRDRGYDFTVDQVVDVARRPGLAFLLDREAWRIVHDVRDDSCYERFRESVRLARERRTLGRLHGVLGSPFAQLPERVRTTLITCRPYLFPRPAETPPMPDLAGALPPVPPVHVRGFDCSDGVFVEAIAADPEGTPLRDYRAAEVATVLAALEAGVPVVTVTGLSGSGKTENIIWNLERYLSGLGHRVVSLDAQLLMRLADGPDRLFEIEETVLPTVLVLDESLYTKRLLRETLLSLADRMLAAPGRHLVLVGGGRSSPGRQNDVLRQGLEPLFARFSSAHVDVVPKPSNLVQAYRFLGLARIDWATEPEKADLLRYILERVPPWFLALLVVRLHEAPPDVQTVAQAKAWVDAQAPTAETLKAIGMVMT